MSGIKSWFAVALLLLPAAPLRGAERGGILVPSSVDGTQQPCYLTLPDGYSPRGPARPLVVSLHSWSGDFKQRNEPLEQAALREGWIVLQPNFRGPNNTPAACGSELAQQDILDAVAWVKKRHRVDPKRIYLTGDSGGGHMTMLMAAKHPKQWTAASAFVGISDLAAWHAKHRGGKYAADLEKACGGAPGASAAVDKQYHDRSPLHFLATAEDLPLDLAAGVNDGHRGSVPIRHTLDAFNVIAQAGNHAAVTAAEIEQLSQRQGRLAAPQPQDTAADPTFGRQIYLRRCAGPVRVTIFEGGHEGIATAAIAWFKAHPGGR